MECDDGPVDPDALFVAEPRLIVEVLSPSTRYTDQSEKLLEYKALSAVEMILFVDPDTVFVELHERGLSDWQATLYHDLDAVFDLGTLGATLSLHAIYEGLDPAPHLAVVD